MTSTKKEVKQIWKQREGSFGVGGGETSRHHVPTALKVQS